MTLDEFKDALYREAQKESAELAEANERGELPNPYAAIYCYGPCGTVFIDYTEYARQMDQPDALWRCPECGRSALFDNIEYERIHSV